MKENLIPKTIHYCWFGGNPLPELAQKCIASWKKYCPDYEIVEWNESNFDVHCCSYAEEAYKAKKWAFVSDVARLYALVNYGGIYMDTDVEVIKPLDSLLEYDAVSGFENSTQIPTGLMAASKGHKMFVELFHDYDNAHFIRPDGSYDTTTNVVRITNACLKHGFIPNNQKQTINGFTLLPSDFLCPKDFDTKEVHLTKNTMVIHHFDGSWQTPEEKYRDHIREKLCRFISRKASSRIANYISTVKYHGFIAGHKAIVEWLKK